MSGQHPGRYFWEVKVILGSSLLSCTCPCSVERIQANTSLVPLTSSTQTVPRYIVYTVYLQCICKSACTVIQYTVNEEPMRFPPGWWHLGHKLRMYSWKLCLESFLLVSLLKIHGKIFNFWAHYLKNIFLQHSNCLSLVERK